MLGDVNQDVLRSGFSTVLMLASALTLLLARDFKVDPRLLYNNSLSMSLFELVHTLLTSVSCGNHDNI